MPKKPGTVGMDQRLKTLGHDHTLTCPSILQHAVGPHCVWHNICVYLMLHLPYLAKHHPKDHVCLCSCMHFCKVLVYQKAEETSCTGPQDRE